MWCEELEKINFKNTNRKWFIYLEDGAKYLIEENYNDKLYTAKNKILYRKKLFFRIKLGKIIKLERCV